ncbi:unnamed protein product [Rotaria socialis]|uniref:ZP-C domain-containing protein n=1 Tax=Rotaria socialis TaxID=392032 RepID=A0A819XB76_9BILA|nr:unnamed protein product [Rotaria socialis]CAF3493040.1 unnamed protein product [Rotaria socialis]CAF4138259.1 unnamed protein product [Rotaria socialis]CAF4233893.1 unnamed protein product [Rotaria socialis]
MYKCSFLLFVISLCCLAIVDAKRRATGQSQHNLGDFCMPGTCASLNSNCKRIGGNAFRCVCKEQYMAINKTHCVKVINASVDDACGSCIKRNGICLDENSNDRMDKCFCPTENDLCNDRTTSFFEQATQPIRKKVVAVTQLIPSRNVNQGDLVLGLYDVNQQRLVDNGGSVIIGDRLFIEIKYRTNIQNSDRHQIIAENCSIASSVSDNEIKLEKLQLLTNRCPSADSRSAVRFQRIDPYHIKSTVFQMNKFQTTSVVYLRCSIAICSGRIENCQERLCPDIRRPSSNRANNTVSIDSTSFDYVDEDSASVLALKRRQTNNYDEEQQQKFTKLITDLSKSFESANNYYEIRQLQQQFTIEMPLAQPAHKRKLAYDTLYGRTSLAAQGAVERSTIIAAISIIFIIGISVSLFVIYRTCYFEYVQRVYGATSTAGFMNGAESVDGGLRSTSQVCRYDMGRRSAQRFDESFFANNVEPLGAYRRQY